MLSAFKSSVSDSARPATAAAGFALSEERMAHGRPKKAGPRKPCGRLRLVDDQGHDATIAHRAKFVGAEYARDPRASHALGMLAMGVLTETPGHRISLADPELTPGSAAHLEQNEDRYKAGLLFAARAHIVRQAWGMPLPTAKSHLAPIIARLLGTESGKEISDSAIAREAENYGKDIVAIRRIPGSTVTDNQRFLVVSRIAIGEVMSLNALELVMLRTSLAALVARKNQR